MGWCFFGSGFSLSRLSSSSRSPERKRLSPATSRRPLPHGLRAQIREQTEAHPGIRLVVVDTFQMVRVGGAELR